METMGDRIKRIRMEHGLSQKELATLVDTPSGQLSRWENNRVEPGIESIRKICQAMSIEEFEITGVDSVVHRHPDRIELDKECDDLLPDELLEARILLRKWKRDRRQGCGFSS